jgi:hypothetical protein
MGAYEAGLIWGLVEVLRQADDTLLSRKDLVAVAGELRKKWRRPGSFRPGLRMPMGVSVTRVEPDTMVVSGVP